MNGSLVVVVCNKKSKGTSPVKYEIFDFYSKLARKLGEKDWEETFQNFSKGIMQNGIKFDGRSLNVKNNSLSKILEIDIPDNMDSDDATEDDYDNYFKCKGFLEKQCQYFSKKEQDVSEVNVDESDEDTGELVNKFKLGITNQIIFIREYAKRKCDFYELDTQSYNSIVSTINALFASKCLISKSVMLKKSDGTIDHIHGIVINKSGLTIDKSKLAKTKEVEISEPKSEKHKTFKSSILLSKCEQKNRMYNIETDSSDDEED